MIINFDEFRQEAELDFPNIRKIPSTGVSYYCDYARDLPKERLRMLWEYVVFRENQEVAGERGIFVGSSHLEEAEKYRIAFASSSGTWKYIGSYFRQRYITEWRRDPNGMTALWREILGPSSWNAEVARRYLSSKEAVRETGAFFAAEGYRHKLDEEQRVFTRTSGSTTARVEMKFGGPAQVSHRIAQPRKFSSLEGSLGVFAPPEWNLISEPSELLTALRLLSNELNRVSDA